MLQRGGPTRLWMHQLESLSGDPRSQRVDRAPWRSRGAHLRVLQVRERSELAQPKLLEKENALHAHLRRALALAGLHGQSQERSRRTSQKQLKQWVVFVYI